MVLAGCSFLLEPLEERASGLIEHTSGILHRTVDASGDKILNYVNTDFFNDIVKPEITTIARNLDAPLDSNASGLISFYKRCS